MTFIYHHFQENQNTSTRKTMTYFFTIHSLLCRGFVTFLHNKVMGSPVSYAQPHAHNNNCRLEHFTNNHTKIQRINIHHHISICLQNQYSQQNMFLRTQNL